MLGGIKIKGEVGTSLFRTLSRRWSPVVPIKPSLPPMSHALGLEAGKSEAPSRAWIGTKRPRVGLPLPAAPAPESSTKRINAGWNPWLWVR